MPSWDVPGLRGFKGEVEVVKALPTSVSVWRAAKRSMVAGRPPSFVSWLKLSRSVWRAVSEPIVSGRDVRAFDERSRRVSDVRRPMEGGNSHKRLPARLRVVKEVRLPMVDGSEDS